MQSNTYITDNVKLFWVALDFYKCIVIFPGAEGYFEVLTRASYTVCDKLKHQKRYLEVPGCHWQYFAIK